MPPALKFPKKSFCVLPTVVYTLSVTQTGSMTRTHTEIAEFQRLLRCSLRNVSSPASVVMIAAMLEVLEWTEGGDPEPFRELMEALAVKYPAQVGQ